MLALTDWNALMIACCKKMSSFAGSLAISRSTKGEYQCHRRRQLRASMRNTTHHIVTSLINHLRSGLGSGMILRLKCLAGIFQHRLGARSSIMKPTALKPCALKAALPMITTVGATFDFGQ